MGKKKKKRTVQKAELAEARLLHPRKSAWRSKLLLVLVSTIGSLAVAEIAVRLLGAAPAFKPIVVSGESSVYQLSDNPILGFELKANYRNPDANLIFSYPSTNAHGQRDVERTIQKPPGIKRVLLLGDSVVEGEGIRDVDDTMSRQLERLYSGGSVEVLNFGVSGYCTRAEVELLEVKGLPFQPDVAVIVFVENDFDNFNKQLYQLDPPKRRPAIVKFLFTRSHLFRFLCLRLDLFHFRAESDPGARNQQAIGENNVVEGLERLAELAERHNFTPLIAVWPKFLKDRIVDEPLMPGGGDGLVIERLARMYGIPTARLSEQFEEHRASTGGKVNPRLTYTFEGDSMHPSVDGARVAAEGLKRALDRLETEPTLSPTPDPEAVAAARKLGNNKPNPAALYFNAANALHNKGKVDEAMQYYRKAVESDPQHLLARCNYATLLAGRGKVPEAMNHYRRALESDPDCEPALYNLGILLVSQGDLKEANDHIRHVFRLRPDLVEDHYRRAVQSLLQGRHAEAIAFLGQVVEAQPDSAEAHLNLGTAHMRAGDYDAAIAAYRQALQLSPDVPLVLKATAWALAVHPDSRKRDPQGAIELARKASELTQDKDATVLDTLAAAYAAAGEFEMAVRTAEAAIEHVSKNPPLAAKIASRLALYRQGKAYVAPPPLQP